MASIISAEIINSYISTEGSNGFMTNYIYYTVLVRYSDSSVSLMNLQAGSSQMQNLLPYVRSSHDILSDVRNDISALRTEVTNIKNDINTMVEQKMAYIIDSCYPIPSILNLGETEALQLLKEANLIPVLKNTYPAGTPATGIVNDYQRDTQNFKKVIVNIIHPIPEVYGMTENEAKEILTNAGFVVAGTVQQVVPNGKEGSVYQCTRDKDSSLVVKLTLCSVAVDFTGMTENEAVEALKQRGILADIRRDYDRRAEGTVFNWENTGKSAVVLYISKGVAIKSFGTCNASVRSEESPTDTCKAEIKMNRKERYWDISLVYSSGSKHDRTIDGIQMKSIGRETNATIVSGSVIKSIADNRIIIKIPTSTDDSNASSLSFTMNTHYGTFSKKNDNISLSFDLTGK